MNATVQKWGNSLAFRIPRSMANDIHVHQGSTVDVIVVEGKMVINPKRKPNSLTQLLQGVTKKNRHSAIDWGKPMGQESL